MSVNLRVDACMGMTTVIERRRIEKQEKRRTPLARPKPLSTIQKGVMKEEKRHKQEGRDATTPAVIKERKEWRGRAARQIKAAFVRLPRRAMLWWGAWRVLKTSRKAEKGLNVTRRKLILTL